MAYDKRKKNGKTEEREETKGGTPGATKRGSSSRNSGRGNQKTGNKAVPATSVASALIATAANISFPVTAGHPLALPFEGADHPTIFKDGSFSMPGIMRIGFVPTPGRATNWSDAFATSTRDFYSLVRHQNSGHSNYTAASMGMYILAGTSCYDWLAYMQRMAGLVRAYGNRNGYLPEKVVAAAGGNYKSLSTNLANLITYINSYAVRLAAMKLPALPFITSHTEMLTNVYRDCDSEKSSFYIFSPDALWIHEYGDTEDDYGMKTMSVPRTMTYEQIVDFGDFLLNAFLNDEMFNIMSGDILKATTDLMPVTIMSPEDVCTPVYDPLMLVRIHNATACWRHPTVAQADLATWTIKEDLSESSNVGAYVFKPYFNIPPFSGSEDVPAANSMFYMCSRKIIDLPTDEINSGLVGDVCRFMVCGKYQISENNTPIVQLEEFGTEILTSALLSYLDKDVVSSDAIRFVTTLDKFDFAPYFFCYKTEHNETAKRFTSVELDWVSGPLMDNYSTIGVKELHEIHRATLLARLGMIK